MSDERSPEVLGPSESGDPFPTEEVKAPFTFKLAIALTVVYLAWRLIQGIAWLFDRIAG